jgi:transposase
LDFRVVVEPGVVDVTEVASWRERAERAEERLAAAESRIEELIGQVAVLSRMLFGRSSEKAETGSGETTEPGGSGPQEGEQAAEGNGVGGGPKPKRGQRPGSVGHGRRDYSHLDSREEIHDVAPEQRTCPDCGRPFEALGFEGSEQVDWSVTITRIVHRHKRYRRACACPGPRTVTAPPAPRPIAKGLFTAGFLARLLFSKYVLGQPVTRIVRHLAAEGLDVAEGTLAGNLKALADLLEPLETAIRARNAAAVHVHADETTWRVYEQTEGKTGHKWWLWVFIADDTIVFRMAEHRSTAVAADHLGIDTAALESGQLPDGRGLLLSTDFYVAYQCLARLDGVDPLWCWAHIRRYFVRAGDAHPYLRAWADAWVARIGDLYLAHQQMAAAEPATGEHTTATAAFEAALAVMDTTRQAQSAHPDLLHPAAAKVLATLDREWEGLARHRDYPDLPLDNNTSERALRTPVVGRKNYYGSHAAWSAHLAARVWTITATAERHGLEPLTHLTDYLNACATNGGKPPEDQALQRFLPWTPDPTTGSRDHDPPQINPTD